MAVNAGALQIQTKADGCVQTWIDQPQKKVRVNRRDLWQYIPAVNDSVVGVITAKLAESFRVEIGASGSCLLPYLSFEGATKRNRPNLKVITRSFGVDLQIGQLVYARVVLADKDMEPELACVSPTTLRADGFGELQGGNVLRCSLMHARRLLDQNHPVLKFLGEKFPFELAVGVNGRIWIKSGDLKHTIVALRAIKQAECSPSSAVCAEIKRQLYEIANE